MSIKDDVITLKKLLFFVETTKNGQINATALKNGLKQSNLSNYIKELEGTLGIQLFNRLANGVTLTEGGQEVFEIACNLQKTLLEVRTYMTTRHNIAGTIRLWAGDGLASGYISECLPSFYKKYPNICIDIKCTIDAPQMIQETDIAIVYTKPKQSDAVIIEEYNMMFGLFASVGYLTEHGCPTSIEDLAENHYLCTRNNHINVWPEWADLLGRTKHIVLQTNSSSMLMQTTKDGIGIALHPIGIGKKENNLVYLDKLNFTLQHPFWLISHSKTKDIEKVRALINHIIEASKIL